MKAYIQRAIDRIKKAEKLSLRLNPEGGFWLAFSGGKDSLCIYHLAEMAGVKFEAHMNFTSVDPPEVVRFVRKQYPNVICHPPIISLYNLAIKQGMPPTRIMRYCCAYYKEQGGAGCVTITGVRRAESLKRASRNEIELSGRKFSGTIDEFDEQGETLVACVKGKDKVILNPIIDWTDSEVWNFLNNEVKVPYCELYDRGRARIGCILCPMSNKGQKRQDIIDYPHQAQKWREVMARLKEAHSDDKDGIFNMSADDIFEWWLTGKSVDEFKNSKLATLF